MQVEIRYFYTNGQEMKQHDIVYLEGFVEEENENFSGFCRLAHINNERLVVYPLGHTIKSGFQVEMYFDHIEKLIKVDGREIDEAINKAVKKVSENYD